MILSITIKLFLKVWDYGQVGQRVQVTVSIRHLEQELAPMVNALLRYQNKKQLQRNAVSIEYLLGPRK